jgi:hypothetical protein
LYNQKIITAITITSNITPIQTIVPFSPSTAGIVVVGTVVVTGSVVVVVVVETTSPQLLQK